MDQQSLYNFTSQTIQTYNTDRNIPESNVTAIADLLLDCADKDGRHGYVRKSEAIIRHINPDIALGDEGSDRRPDKVVLQRSAVLEGEIIRVIHLEDERKVIIVECKSDHDFNPRAVDQIRAYMTLADFPHGLLLSQRRATLFSQGDDEQGIRQTHHIDNIEQHVQELADLLRDL
jgi:hypothetical protein